VAATKYKLVFSGKISDSKEVEEVKRDLASLLGCPVSKVGPLFSGKRIILKKQLDQESARRYKEAFERVGALCQVVEDAGESGLLREKILTKPSLLGVPRMVRGSIAFQPQPSSRLTGWQNGVNVNRNDVDKILFQQIRLLSAFTDIGQGEDQAQLLLFVEGFKRPFLVDAHQIKYSDFPAVEEETSASSLRKFLEFLFSKNPEIGFDKATWDFVQGDYPQVLESDLLSMATALAREMEAYAETPPERRGDGLQGPEDEEEETTLHPPAGQQVRCSECGFEQERSDVCLSCGAAIEKDEAGKVPVSAEVEWLHLPDQLVEVGPKERDLAITMEFQGSILSFFAMFMLVLNPLVLPIGWGLTFFFSWATHYIFIPQGYSIRYEGRGEEIWYAPLLFIFPPVLLVMAIPMIAPGILHGYESFGQIGWGKILLVLSLAASVLLTSLYFMYRIVVWTIASLKFSWGGELEFEGSYWGFVLWFVLGSIFALLVNTLSRLVGKAAGSEALFQVFGKGIICFCLGVFLSLFIQWMIRFTKCSTHEKVVWTGSAVEAGSRILLAGLIPMVFLFLPARTPVLLSFLLYGVAAAVYAYVIHWLFCWIIRNIKLE